MKVLALALNLIFVSAASYALTSHGAAQSELSYGGLPTLTYIYDSNQHLTAVRSGGHTLLTIDWSGADAIATRLPGGWTVAVDVTPANDGRQRVADGSGVARNEVTVAYAAPARKAPPLHLDVFAAETGLPADWQANARVTGPDQIELVRAGAPMTIRLHPLGAGVRIALDDSGTPLFWDVDLPLNAGPRIERYLPSRLIVTTHLGVELVSAHALEGSIDSAWVAGGDNSKAHVRYLTEPLTRGHARALMYWECGHYYHCTYSQYGGYGYDDCNWDTYWCWSDDGGGGGGTPPDSGGGGGGGGTSYNGNDMNNNGKMDNWRNIVSTTDPCADNFGENDRKGVNLGGTNTVRPEHKGVDIQANDGDNIAVPFRGSVTHIGYDNDHPPCGYHVHITEADGSIDTFCHMQDGSSPLAVGQQVEVGASVGRVGMTGHTTGPHLHFTHKNKSGGYDELFTLTDNGASSSQLTAGGC